MALPKGIIEHMFDSAGLLQGDGVEVELDAELSVPLRFRGAGAEVHGVVAVHGRWREWSVAGTDVECWRVESASGLVVVLARDLRARTWVVAAVWD